MKVGVIGAGAWGTALAVVAARGGCDVLMWSFDGEYMHFDGVTMPQNLAMTRKLAEMRDMDMWLMVTPSAFFRETMTHAREFYRNQPVIICSKGAEISSGKFMSEVLHDTLPECTDFAVLSGPQFAAEVAQGVPTGSTLAGTHRAIDAACIALNQLYLAPSDDVVGTELCGVGKNAVALICGYNTVAGQGENERALIFTRAWGEIVEIGRHAGAKCETFLGLCGIGDLFLSATSPTSRNFSGGMSIARGDAPTGTVEGIFALQGLIRRAAASGTPTPVLCEMCDKMGLK